MSRDGVRTLTCVLVCKGTYGDIYPKVSRDDLGHVQLPGVLHLASA